MTLKKLIKLLRKVWNNGYRAGGEGLACGPDDLFVASGRDDYIEQLLKEAGVT